MKKLYSVVVACFLSASLSWAVPSLQLDIAGGTYDHNSDTVIASANPFTLYALLDTATLNSAGTFYLSAAIIPKSTAGGFGSFTVNGNTYSSANMIYGTPPAAAIHNSDELQAHGIYDTYYAEIAFTFNPDNKALSYNSQDDPGGFTTSASGSLLYNTFDVDISGLGSAYNVHFDLYNIRTDKKGNIEAYQFAPFSHDAQGGTRLPPPPPPPPPVLVPDTGSTLMLLGISLAGAEFCRRRLGRKV